MHLGTNATSDNTGKKFETRHFYLKLLYLIFIFKRIGTIAQITNHIQTTWWQDAFE